MRRSVAALLGRLLFREARHLRTSVDALQQQVARIADALDAANAHQWPQSRQPDPSLPPVEITYTDTRQQVELMEIELALTRAIGQPPSEDDVLAEYERRREMRG